MVELDSKIYQLLLMDTKFFYLLSIQLQKIGRAYIFEYQTIIQCNFSYVSQMQKISYYHHQKGGDCWS